MNWMPVTGTEYRPGMREMRAMEHLRENTEISTSMTGESLSEAIRENSMVPVKSAFRARRDRAGILNPEPICVAVETLCQLVYRGRGASSLLSRIMHHLTGYTASKRSINGATGVKIRAFRALNGIFNLEVIAWQEQ